MKDFKFDSSLPNWEKKSTELRLELNLITPTEDSVLFVLRNNHSPIDSFLEKASGVI